ncbi:hypothetical protein [Crenobacter intestini]|uniref:Uncharacterized protein n=1 Tax=Crenobacter intestini TaxID=2563443 RepID=A0A4T0V620_9NEIS|nr:hypothetical protein [Crenobacter intestini]TIC87059.1 hypothetical protein E5K04_01175 [Crenobacter intestini]
MSQANRPAGVPDNLPVLTEVVEYADDAPTAADEPLALEMPAELTLDELLPPPAAAVFETLPSLDLDIPEPAEALPAADIDVAPETAPLATRWSEPVVSPKAWQATPADELFASPWVAAPRALPPAASAEPQLEAVVDAEIPELSLDDLLFEADMPASGQVSEAAAEMAAAWAQLAPAGAVSPEPEQVSGLELPPAEAAGEPPLDELLGELAWPQATADTLEPALRMPEALAFAEAAPVMAASAAMAAPESGSEEAVSALPLVENPLQAAGFARESPVEPAQAVEPLDAAPSIGAAPVGLQPEAQAHAVDADAAEAEPRADLLVQALPEVAASAPAVPLVPPAAQPLEAVSDGQMPGSEQFEAPSAWPVEPELAVPDLQAVNEDTEALAPAAGLAAAGAWMAPTDIAVPAAPESVPSLPDVVLPAAAEAGLESFAPAAQEAVAEDVMPVPAEAALPEPLAPAVGLGFAHESAPAEAEAGLPAMSAAPAGCADVAPQPADNLPAGDWPQEVEAPAFAASMQPEVAPLDLEPALGAVGQLAMQPDLPEVADVALPAGAEAMPATLAAVQLEAASGEVLPETFAGLGAGSLSGVVAPVAGFEPAAGVPAMNAAPALSITPPELAEPEQPFGLAEAFFDAPAVQSLSTALEVSLPEAVDAPAALPVAGCVVEAQPDAAASAAMPEAVYAEQLEALQAEPQAPVPEPELPDAAQPVAGMAEVAADESAPAVESAAVIAEGLAEPELAQDVQAVAGAAAVAGLAVHSGAQVAADEDVAVQPKESTAERVAVVDEAALLEAIYQRILPRMRVELSLWLQDAIENQTRHLLVGVMQQMREDYDMLFGETLRESIRQAINDIETKHKDEQ